MSVNPIHSAIASSVAGTSAGEEHAVKRAKREDEDRARFRRALDNAEVSVDASQAADAVRSAKGNSQEEASEDRREHDNYSVARPPADGKSLDIEG